jgi:phage tail-like protein
MPPFPVNPLRRDPYENTKFRVKWDGQYIYGISRINGLERVTQVVTHRDGGSPSAVSVQPGLNVFSPLVLERGRTQDLTFENWANLVWRFGAGLGSEQDIKNMRKDLIVELMNEAGQVVMAWKVYRCWPSEYAPVGELFAASSDGAIERLTLQNEGWERDTSVVEPIEP